MFGKEKKTDLNESFLLEKKYLLYTGFYPTVHPLKWAFAFFAITTWAITFAQFATMVAQVYLDRENLPIVAQIANFSMVQVAFIFKLANFARSGRQLLEIEEKLRDAAFEGQAEILAIFVGKCKRVALVYKILCVICIALHALYPILDEDEEHLVTLPGWYPYQVRDYRYQTLAFQVATIAVSAFLNSTIDIVTYMLITLGSAQFEMLKANLLAMKGDDAAVLARLRGCVVHHIKILESVTFVRYVEDVFSNGIFLQFLASIVIICMTGFQILVVSKTSIQFVLLIFYFTCMMCQVGMYCWYGHEIMIGSEGVRDACYTSEWYNCGPKVRKVLFLMMERSKRPVVLTAGKMFTLTLATLANMMRSSYSYFAVLQRVYSKKIA